MKEHSINFKVDDKTFHHLTKLRKRDENYSRSSILRIAIDKLYCDIMEEEPSRDLQLAISDLKRARKYPDGV